MLAAADHVVLGALVPSLMLRATPVAPFVSNETRMFSIDCAERAQYRKAAENALETSAPVVSKILAGKSVKLRLLYQALRNVVAAVGRLLGERAGNDVRLPQLRQALLKLLPLEKLRSGIDIKPESYQAELKLTTFDVSINGNDVRAGHARQVFEKFVTADVSMLPIVVRLAEPLKASFIRVPKLQPSGVSPSVIISSPD